MAERERWPTMSRESLLNGHVGGLEDPSVRESLARLLARDPRFSIHAYRFVMSALSTATIKHHGIVPTNSSAGELPDRQDHVTGQQLAYAVAGLAAQEFGFLGYRVLSSWGIRTTGDIGDIVYHMIDENHMQKSPTDSRSDFDDVFDLRQAIEDEYRFEISEF
jgi:uncharacterized repeat protein (TIGR04138 family)